jgi:hypothetical protein
LSTHLRLGLLSGLFPSGFPINIQHRHIIFYFIADIISCAAKSFQRITDVYKKIK